jgi:putative endonuclease
VAVLRALLSKLGFGRGVGGAADRSVGARGEDVAVAFLKRLGYTIIDRNVRVPMGEADIVARDGVVVVLVEVKSRIVQEGKRQPKAEEQVGAFKRRKLLAIMAHLVRANGWEREKKRIDVVAVEFGGGAKRGAEGGGGGGGGGEPVVRHFVNAVKP